ncbi:MAG: tape measure protein [Bacillota bacterium]|nr:tape measure protein [Bacillota bacterium]
MGTISTSIQITDGLTPALKKMDKAIQTTVKSFESLQKATRNAVDTSALQKARSELSKTKSSVSSLEQSFKKLSAAGKDFKKSLQVSSDITKVKNSVGSLQQKMNGLTTAGKNFKKTLQVSSDITKVKNSVGSLQQKMNGLTKAGKDFKKSLQVSSDITKAKNSITGLQQKINKLSSAGKNIKNSIKNRSAQTKIQSSGGSIEEGTGGDKKKKSILSVGATVVGKIGDYALQIASMSDQYTQMNTKVKMMNDGLQSTRDLQDLIYSSAQNTGTSYQDMTDTVGNLGARASGAFSGSKELIAFSDLMTKNFKMGGASIEDQASGMEQLTNAMAQGSLQGDAFDSVLQTAPGIIQSIADYMNLPVDQVRNLADQGKLSSDVIKNAMFSAADQTNQKFGQMPRTFSDLKTEINNSMQHAFQPVFEKIGQLANMPQIQTFIRVFAGGLEIAAEAALWVLGIIGEIGNFIANNWDTMGPIILGVAFAMGVLAIASGIASIGQWALNASLYACPIVWIILAIIALIAIFFIVIAVINRLTGQNLSAVGLICGAFMWLGATILNVLIGAINGAIQLLWSMFVTPFLGLIEWILNVCNGGFTSFGGAVFNLLGQIISQFLSLGTVVTKIIDAIFGTKWTNGIKALQKNVLSWGKNGNTSITLNRDAPEIARVDPGAAFNAGNKFGTNIQKSIGNAFSMKGLGNKDDLLGGLTDKMKGLQDKFMPGGAGAGAGAGGINDALGNIAQNTADTAGNTAAMSDSMDSSDEDMQYLRDIAEQEAINRFTTAEIKVDMVNHNNVNSGMDLDGIVSYLEDKVYQSMSAAAEGAYA